MGIRCSIFLTNKKGTFGKYRRKKPFIFDSATFEDRFDSLPAILVRWRLLGYAGKYGNALPMVFSIIEGKVRFFLNSSE